MTLLICLIVGCSTSKTIPEPVKITKVCSYPPILKPSPILAKEINIQYDPKTHTYIFKEQDFKNLVIWVGDVDVYVDSISKILQQLQN